MSAASDTFAAAAADLANALAAAVNDPADAVRLLVPLAGWEPPTLPGRGALSQNARAAQAALADTLRCSACAALAAATLDYQPVSYQDAQALRVLVCDALDAQATRCADAGRNESYEALRILRTAVALDLALRGANLARLVEVQTAQSYPSLTEAWTLYQDPTREPGLVASADPANPAFLPVSFPTLSK